MRQIGRHGASTRKETGNAKRGIRISSLVTVLTVAALCMLVVPSLATAIVGPSTPKAALAPVDTAAPTLTGTAALGQTLSCSQGTWTNAPTGFSFTWLRSGVPIAGQAGSTYVVQAADEGHAISCRVTASNGGGSYTVSSLPTGSYKVGFYVEQESGNYLTQYYSGKPLFAEASPVAVTSPNATGAINAELHAGGQIGGRVTDAATHTALANIFVCASDEVAGKVEYGGCASTSANGEYTISGLQSGPYTVQFSALFSEGHYAIQYYSGKSAPAEAQQVAVTAGSTAAGINAELSSLDQQGQITGRVTKAAGGLPISSVEVCASEPSGEYFGGCTQTNSNGEYAIAGLAQAEYIVSFVAETCTSSGCTQQNYVTQYYNGKAQYAEATPVKVEASKTTENIGAKLEEGEHIDGTVTSAAGGAPLSGIYVCAEGVGGTELVDDCASTNGTGEYVLQALVPGEYTVSFSGSGNYLTQYYNGKAQFAEATPVKVEAGKTTENIDAKMFEGGQITGTVTDASSHAAIAEIEVCASGSGVEYSNCTTTSAGGGYTLSGLPAGSYNVSFYAYQEGLNYLSQSDNGISVTDGVVTPNVNAEMSHGGQITGVVTDASTHLGLAQIEVCADEVGGAEVEQCARTTTGAASASASSNALTIPGSNFTQAKPPVFDAKRGVLEFFFTVATAGEFKWSLFFRNADVGFADSLGLSLKANEATAGDGSVDTALAEAARKKKAKGCKKGTIKHHGKCVKLLVPFGSGSQTVAAGTVELKVHPSSRAIKALNAGRSLHVSGTFTFQSALGGPAVSHSVSVLVRKPKQHSKKHGKGHKR